MTNEELCNKFMPSIVAKVLSAPKGKPLSHDTLVEVISDLFKLLFLQDVNDIQKLIDNLPANQVSNFITSTIASLPVSVQLKSNNKVYVSNEAGTIIYSNGKLTKHLKVSSSSLLSLLNDEEASKFNELAEVTALVHVATNNNYELLKGDE